MSGHELSTEFTAAVLKELKEKRALRTAIDSRIGQLEKLLEGHEAAIQKPQKKKPNPQLAPLALGDACVWMLRQIEHPMTNREILDTLKAAGYKKAKSTEHIGAALHHRKKTSGDVNRVGNQWVYVSAREELKAVPLHEPIVVEAVGRA